MVTDAENAMVATTDKLDEVGILLSTTIRYHHNRPIERWVQTIRKRQKVILSTLTYEAPDFLVGELLNYLCMSLDLSVNHNFGRRTPYELFYLKKSDFKQISQPCQAPMYEGPDATKVVYFGIAVGWHRTTPTAIRVYMKHCHRIVTRAYEECKFYPDIPLELKRRSRVPHRIYVREGDDPLTNSNLPVANP